LIGIECQPAKTSNTSICCFHINYDNFIFFVCYIIYMVLYNLYGLGDVVYIFKTLYSLTDYVFLQIFLKPNKTRHKSINKLKNRNI
jgi:hypothetical protein